MTRSMRALLLLLAPLIASCSRCGGGASTTSAPAPSASASAAATGSRCELVGRPSVFGALAGEDASSEGPVAYGAELGGAIADKSAFVVGARAAGLLGAAHVLEISFDGALQSLAQLPPAPGGARPPLLAPANDGTRLVGTLTIEEKSRTFHVARLTKDGLRPAFDQPQGKDESETTTLLATTDGALVAWDDADDKAGLGRVRARVLPSAGTDAGADDDLASPPTSDAAWPLLVPSPNGDRAILLWATERLESENTDGGGEPSQALAQRWIEAVMIEVATGKRLSAPRALTALDGHAQTFRALWGDAGLLLVVRDDPRPTDGDGGELFALRSTIDASSIGEPARISIAEKDVAPGVASLVPRSGGALVAWLAHDGTARLTPAFTIGGVTLEPSLRDRRVIATHDDRILASRIVGSGIELTVLRCAP
jgi:hypothetical protein